MEGHKAASGRGIDPLEEELLAIRERDAHQRLVATAVAAEGLDLGRDGANPVGLRALDRPPGEGSRAGGRRASDQADPREVPRKAQLAVGRVAGALSVAREDQSGNDAMRAREIIDDRPGLRHLPRAVDVDGVGRCVAHHPAEAVAVGPLVA